MIYIPMWSAVLGLVLMFAGGAALSGLVMWWWFLRLAPPGASTGSTPKLTRAAGCRHCGTAELADAEGLAHCPGCAHRYGTCPCRPGGRCGCPEDMVTTVGPVDITSDSIPVYRDDPEEEEGWGKRAWEEIKAEGSGPFPVVPETSLASPAAVDVARSMVEQDQDAAEFMAGLAERRMGIMRELTAA